VKVMEAFVIQSIFVDTHQLCVCSTVSTQLLAHSGFYYEGKNDTVRCAYCRGRLNRWKPNDDPLYEHHKVSERDCAAYSIHKTNTAADTMSVG